MERFTNDRLNETYKYFNGRMYYSGKDSLDEGEHRRVKHSFSCLSQKLRQIRTDATVRFTLPEKNKVSLLFLTNDADEMSTVHFLGIAGLKLPMRLYKNFQTGEDSLILPLFYQGDSKAEVLDDTFQMIYGLRHVFTILPEKWSIRDDNKWKKDWGEMLVNSQINPHRLHTLDLIKRLEKTLEVDIVEKLFRADYAALQYRMLDTILFAELISEYHKELIVTLTRPSQDCPANHPTSIWNSPKEDVLNCISIVEVVI
jgi:hypothetical protein